MSYEDEKPMVGSTYQPASTRRRCCVVSVLSVVVALVLIVAIAVSVGLKNARGHGESTPEGINSACAATSYPDDCRASLQGSDGTPRGMLKAALYTADQLLAEVDSQTTDPDCKDLLETAREQVQVAINATDITDPVERNQTCADEQTGLSAALENLETCRVSLTESASSEASSFPSLSLHATKALSNALALVNCLCLYGTDLSSWKDTLMNLPDNWNFNDLFGNGGTRRRLMSYEEAILPTWMDRATSRHLLARPPAYNVIVAKDGSGKYRTVSEAIQHAPQTGQKNANRYIIYVKAGVYNEQITVPKKCTNLVIIGDGIDQTIFTGARCVENGNKYKMTTFASATLSKSHVTFLKSRLSVEMVTCEGCDPC
jgi:pectinesterase